ncbi:MAG: hypothetical protein ACPLSO_05350 [Fervidicoccaceae archaeon]
MNQRAIAGAFALIIIAMMFATIFYHFGKIAMIERERIEEIAHYNQLQSFKQAERIFFNATGNSICMSSTIATKVVLLVVYTPGNAEINRFQDVGATIPANSCVDLKMLGIGSFINANAGILILTQYGNAFFWNYSLGTQGMRLS